MSFWHPGALPASQILFQGSTVEAALVAQEQARIAGIERSSSGPANVALSFRSELNRWDVSGAAEDNTIQTIFTNRWVVTGQRGFPDLDPGYAWSLGVEVQVKDAGDMILCEVYYVKFGAFPVVPVLFASSASNGTNVDGAIVNVPGASSAAFADGPASFSVKVTSGPSATAVNPCRVYGVDYTLTSAPLTPP
jgi:hypothetical protein